MSDEKPKAFAERKWNLSADGTEWAGLHVAGICVLTDDDADVTALEDLAVAVDAALCAAVDQREARLVAALRAARDHLACSSVCATNFAGYTRATCDCGAEPAIAAVRAALTGHGDYVHAEQLRAEQEKTRGVWAVLNDVAHEGGLASERAAALMAAVGLKTEEDPTWWSEDELLRRQTQADRERARRRALGKTKPRACAHCNDMPYIAADGLNTTCPECGEFRPVVADMTG